jgi:hypothetical protein
MPDDLASTLAGWQAITRAATIGPWEKIGFDDIWSQPAGRHVAETMNREADAEFIVTARTVMPLLLAAIEAVLKLGDRSGEATDPTLPGHVDVYMIREAITRELTGPQLSEDGGHG